MNMEDKEILFNNGSVTLSELTYKKIRLQLSENSPTYFYLLRKKERNIACAIEYLEKNNYIILPLFYDSVMVNK